MKEWIIMVLVLVLSCGNCMAKFVVEKSKLKVTSPESLKGEYESSIGNFGIPDYGGTLTGIVTYHNANNDSCDSFQDFNVSFKASPGGLPTFLLADRGGCFFTVKAWNAQNAGAAAIIVADNKDEELITMDFQEQNGANGVYLQNITIPSTFINESLGEDIKNALAKKEMVRVNLDWTESLPHPDGRVEYEFWTNSNYECGMSCDTQVEFVKNFKGAAQILEQNGYTQFIPRYVTWYCPQEYLPTDECKSQCINNGRYCAPDPEQDLTTGYEGKEVVLQNLLQACFFKVASELKKPWLWWDYVTDFVIRCPMKEKKYNKECAHQVIKSLGVDLKKIEECMGDPNSDEENALLKAQQEAQIGSGSRGDVRILPTVVINNRQYRGKLDKTAVLKAICAGFKETTEPSICLREDIETNQCMEKHGGCWHDDVVNLTACKDTFRGRVCECPTVQGVKFVGDGYTHCEASGPLPCKINNGGCWMETQNGTTYSACSDGKGACKCPPGFTGDGNSCLDVDECKEKQACQCRECKCKNTWGSYECSCRGSLYYMKENDICINTNGSTGFSWGVFWIIVLGLTAAGVGGYVVYKYRIRRYMDSEIRSIMAQYMPLDSEPQVPAHGSHADI